MAFRKRMCLSRRPHNLNADLDAPPRLSRCSPHTGSGTQYPSGNQLSHEIRVRNVPVTSERPCPGRRCLGNQRPPSTNPVTPSPSERCARASAHGLSHRGLSKQYVKNVSKHDNRNSPNPPSRDRRKGDGASGTQTVKTSQREQHDKDGKSPRCSPTTHHVPRVTVGHGRSSLHGSSFFSSFLGVYFCCCFSGISVI